MRWAITGDLQFDQQLRYATILPNGLSSRLVHAVECFQWVVETAVSQECSGLLVLGDVFESRAEIDVSVLDQACRAVGDAASELPVKILAGNHDCYLRAPKYTTLQVFSGMADVYDEPAVSEGFAFMPWIEDGDLYRKGVKQLADQGGAKVLLSHCLLQGAVPGGKGRSPADLLPDHWGRIILGDVHEPVALLDCKIQYCGAPMQWHYGDAGGKRGFFILDTSSDELEFVENDQSPRFHVITSSDDDLSKIDEGDFVRVSLESPMETDGIVKLAKAVTPHVESTLVEVEDDDPRLVVHTSNTHEEVLQAYVEYQEVAGAEGLVELGLELLEEAKL